MTIDAAELELLTDTLHKTMSTTAAGPALDAALDGLGWPEMLAEMPGDAVPVVFRLLGETGTHAPVLNDVVLAAAGRPVGGTIALPCAGDSWVVWERSGDAGAALDLEIPVRRVDAASAIAPGVAGPEPFPLAAGRRALGWWLVGTGRAMLDLARTHALDRVQFGRPLASFQAVRHRLAETYVALEGAEATLLVAGDGADRRDPDADLCALLAKAAAGRAALTAARHSQQVLGGIGFTAEHDLHRHVRRALLLDGLLGNARELTREAGALLRARGSAPRLAHL